MSEGISPHGQYYFLRIGVLFFFRNLGQNRERMVTLVKIERVFSLPITTNGWRNVILWGLLTDTCQLSYIKSPRLKGMIYITAATSPSLWSYLRYILVYRSLCLFFFIFCLPLSTLSFLIPTYVCLFADITIMLWAAAFRFIFVIYFLWWCVLSLNSLGGKKQVTIDQNNLNLFTCGNDFPRKKKHLLKWNTRTRFGTHKLLLCAMCLRMSIYLFSITCLHILLFTLIALTTDIILCNSDRLWQIMSLFSSRHDLAATAWTAFDYRIKMTDLIWYLVGKKKKQQQ